MYEWWQVHFIYSFILFCSSNQQSQAVAIHNELDRKATKHRQLPITHTRLTALFPGLARWAGTREVKPIWILLKQETVSGSGISWAICKSAPSSRQMITPASHHSGFYRPDALPAAQRTALKHTHTCMLYSRLVENNPQLSVGMRIPISQGC